MKLEITNHTWQFVGDKEYENQQWVEYWSLNEMIDISKYNKLITFAR